MLAGPRASSLPCSGPQGRQGPAHTGFSLVARKQGECEIDHHYYDYVRDYGGGVPGVCRHFPLHEQFTAQPHFMQLRNQARSCSQSCIMVLNSAAFTKFAELQEKELLQKEAEMAQKLLQAQKEAKQAQKKAEQAQKLADMAVVGPIAVFTCLSRIRAPPKRCLTSLGPLKFGLWTQMRLGSEPRIRTAPSSCAGLAQQSKDSCRSLCHPLLPGSVGDGLNAWTLRDLGPHAAAG